MSTEDLNMSEDAEMAECEGDKVVTMMDVLQEQQEFEDDANAVLGGSDDKNCTYPKGYIKRQALYACITCCPDTKDNESNRAGVCLACSLMCHENHELVELYTKRNFRCDCGNPKFNSHPCQFTPDKPELNEGNTYNQNFSGLYCICHRPYPDPEATFEDDMIQCIICEDWLHASHLDATVPGNDQYAEMICKACMEKNEFLHDYTIFAVNSESGDVDVVNDSNADISLCNGDGVKLVNGINEKVNENLSEIPVVTNGSLNECETKETELPENEPKVSEKVEPDESSKVNDIEGQEVTKIDTTQMDVDTEPKLNESETKKDINEEKSDVDGTKPEMEIESNKLTESQDNLDTNTVADSCETNLDSKEEPKVSDKIENSEADSTKMESTDTSTNDTQNENNEDKPTETNSEILTNSKNETGIENPQSTSEVEESKNDAVSTTDATAKDPSEITEQESINETKEKLETSETPEQSNEKSVINDPVMDAIDELLNSDKKEETSAEIAEPDSCSNTKVMDTDDSVANDENKDSTEDSAALNAALPSDNKDENAPTLPTNETKDLETDTQELNDNSTKENEALIENGEPTVDSSKVDESENPEVDSTNTEIANEESESINTKPAENENITNGHQDNDSKDESNDKTETTNHKRKLSTETKEDNSPKKAKIIENCTRPKHGKKAHKGATFWPSNFRSKLCTCGQCITMYKDLNVLFLTDLEDAVSYYENLGKSNVDSGISQYEKGMQALSSLDRIQQINALTEYNNMRDKLLDFLKSFKDRKEIVKEEDIKAFFAGMKPRREPDGVYFCR